MERVRDAVKNYIETEYEEEIGKFMATDFFKMVQAILYRSIESRGNND
jgi:hypothetical protein